MNVDDFRKICRFAYETNDENSLNLAKEWFTSLNNHEQLDSAWDGINDYHDEGTFSTKYVEYAKWFHKHFSKHYLNTRWLTS